MANLSEDEEIPELVEVHNSPAVPMKPSNSRRKSDSTEKVPITIVTGLPTCLSL